MLIELTQEDCKKAIKAHETSNSLCTTCVVFQAAKRAGLNPIGVFVHGIQLKNGTKLIPKNEKAYDEVMYCEPEQWESLEGKVLEFK